MPNQSDLKILITGQLNVGKSIGEINTQLKGLEKKVNKLKLNIQINDNVIKTLNNFSQQFSKIESLAKNAGKVITESLSPDGTKIKITSFDGVPQEIQKTIAETKKLKQSLEDVNTSNEKDIAFSKQQIALRKQLVSLYTNGKNITKEQLTETARLVNTLQVLDKNGEKQPVSITYAKAEVDRLNNINKIINKKDEELKYEQKITDTINKRNEKRGTLIGSSDNLKDLNNVNEKQLQNVLKVNEAFDKQQVIATSLDKVTGRWSVTLKENARQQKVISGEIDKATGKIYKQKEAISDVSSRNIGLIEQFKIAATRVPLWLAGTTLTFGSIHAVQNMLDVLITVDDKITSLKKVMDQDTNFESMLKSATEQAYEFGRTIDNSLASMQTFAQMGFNEEQVKALSANAMLLSTIGDMSDTDSSELLTSAVLQFNMAAEDSIKIVDSWNNVSNKYAVTSLDLAQAIARSGQSASVAKVSFDELNGMVATIQASTRRGGQQIGNSLKTIFTRLRMDEVKTALNDIGIAVYDTSGDFRSATDIFSDLSKQWNNLTNVQKSFIGEQIAGKFHINNFMALMNQFDMAISATSDSVNSFGSGMNELSTFQDSLTFRLQNLKASFQELSLTIGDAVLTDGFLATVETLGFFAKTGSNLVPILGALPPVITAISMAMLALNNATRTQIMENGKLIISQGSLRASSVLLLNTFKSIKAFMAGTFLPLAGIFAATWAIEKLIGAVSKANKEMQDTRKRQEDMVKSYSQQGEQVNKLVSEYEKLSNIRKTSGLDIEQEKRYTDLQNELGSILPSVVKEINAKGDSLLVSSENIKEQIKVLEELIALEKEKARLDAPKKLEEGYSKIDQLKEEAKYQKDVIKDLEDGKKVMENSGRTRSEILEVERKIAEWKIKQKVTQTQINEEARKNAENFKPFFDDLNLDKNTVDKATLLLSTIDMSGKKMGEIEGIALSAVSAIDEYNNALSSGDDKKIKETENNLSNLLDAYSKGKLTVKDFADAINDIDNKKVELGIFYDTKGNDPVKSYDELNQAVDEGIPLYDEAGQVISDLGNSLDGSSKKSKNFSDELDELYSKISTANKAIQDYKEGNSLTAQSIDEILDIYPQLLGYIGDEAEFINQLGIERDKDIEKAKKNLYDKLENNTIFYNESVKTNSKLVDNFNEMYGVDLTNFKSLAEAKNAVESKLISKLSEKWAKYYNVQGKTLSEEGRRLQSSINFYESRGMEVPKELNDAYDTVIGVVNSVKGLDKAFEEITYQGTGLNYDKIGLSSSGSKGNKGSKSSGSKDEAKIQDVTEAIINQINAESRLAEAKNKTTKEQIDEISSQQKYREQIELTNKLISGQEDEINKLTKANNNLHIEAEKVRAKTKYDTYKWFDDELNPSLAFEQLKNSLKTGTAQEELQKLFDSLQKIKLAHRDNSQAIQDLTKSTKDYRQELNNLQLTAMKYKYDQQLDDIDFLLEKHKLLTSDLEEGSVEYSKAMEEQIPLINQKIALTEQEIQNTLDLMAVQQEDSLIIGELKERYEDLVIAQLQYQQQLSSLKREIKSKQREIANEIIDIIKDAYKKQEQVALDSIDREMDALEDAHKQKVKMLDDQISKIEEYIKVKLKQIDTEESERDFTKELQKLQEERQKIQNKINEISADDSREANVTRIGLEEERAKLTEQINELTHDRQIDLRKENLQDQLDTYKKDYENKKDIEDDKYEKEKKRLEDIRKETQRHYENLINDERRFAQIRESIMDGNLSNIKSMLGDFEDFIGDNMNTIGESISENLIDRINDARKEIERLNELEREYDRASSSSKSSSGSSKSSGSNKSSSGSSSSEKPILTLSESSSLGGFKLVGSTATAWVRQLVGAIGGDTGDIDFDEKTNKVTYDGKTFDVMYNNSGRAYIGIKDFMRKFGHDVEFDSDKRKVSIYHSGGIVGGNGSKESELLYSLFTAKPNEEFAKLLKSEEFVVNAKKAMPNFKNNINNMVNSIQPRQQGANKIEIKEFIKIGNITKDANINIDNLVDTAMNRFVQKLKPYGFTF